MHNITISRLMMLIVGVIFINYHAPGVSAQTKTHAVIYASGDVLNRENDPDQKTRVIKLEFEPEFESKEQLEEIIRDNLKKISVTEEQPDQGSPAKSATTSEVNLTINHVYAQSSSFVYLEVPGGINRGRGYVNIQTIVDKGHTINSKRLIWRVVGDNQYPPPKPAFNADFKFNEDALIGSFSFVATTDFRRSGSNVIRDYFNIQGFVPLTAPEDAEDTAGAETDASKAGANYLQTSLERRVYEGTSDNYHSWGFVARTSGRFNGYEIVGRYQPFARLFDQGEKFFGAEVEAGLRDGKNEWENLTVKAPDRGNLVARLGTVFEWAPKLGPINLDIGNGLRFFVRGRGWLDYAEHLSEDSNLRLRGFLDTELLYNLNSELRVFVRYELGHLPPDLTRRREALFLGIGGAF